MGDDPADKHDRASITEQAFAEFNRFEQVIPTHNLPLGPVYIQNFSLKKDVEFRSENGLKTAPNFASAILSRPVANLLGLSGAPKQEDSPSFSSSQYVFKNVTAVIRPAESILLLGPSSSGKTTFMRTLGDVLGGSSSIDGVEGSVRLGPTRWDPSECSSVLKRTVAFTDQSDLTLTPILTVEETVRFARSCTENLDPDVLEESLSAFFRLAGLDHVRHTVVGNADIRGVSGGQKRRVKMLEMAVGTDVTIFFLDEITNGLDAASALSICKVIRAAVQAQNMSAVTSLLQPSDDVYRTFHRLILLTPKGEVAYSGKTEDAESHFEVLGLKRPDGMNLPEFLLRCASTPADLYDGTEIGGLPLSSSSDLADAFITSPAGQALTRELEEKGEDRTETESAFASDGKTPQLKAFAQPTSRQIKLLLERGFTLVKRNPATLMRIISAIIFGVFIGTLFLHTPSDEAGTETRAGYVLTLIFLSFLNSCMAPLDDLYADRLTFYIHRRASFYRTVSYYISQVVCSWSVAMCEAFLLCVLSFFAVGMSGGWAFVYFWLMFTLLCMSGTAVSRCLAYSLPTNDMAQSLGPAALLLFVLSSCYSPTYLDLPSWLRWLAWLSPCAYCYEGIIVSETAFRSVGNYENGQSFAQEYLGIPRIAFGTPNATPALSTPGGVLAFDAYMLLCLTLIFDAIACTLLHRSQSWYGPTTQRYQVASGQSLTAPPWSGVCKKSSIEADSSSASDSGIPPAPPAHLTAKNIVYEVDVELPAADDGEKKGDETVNLMEAAPEASNDEDSQLGSPITARDYSQVGNGALSEFVLKPKLGVGSSKSKSSINSLQQPEHEEPPEPGRLRLLSGITASFEPGTLNALMGESGAGKTTLLDCVAGYKTDGHLLGDIKVNGLEKNDGIWRSIAGYCEQVDLHNPSLTVTESLIFAARMRLRPFSLPDYKKVSFANNIMELLELEEYADMLVGDEASGEGLPKHARKRLTVGVELAANPSILFCDEPTSGLDSLSAAMVVSSLKRAAKQGLTVVCTIHQPSREVFLAFDNLLLLKKGGICVYNGSISKLNGYLSSAGDSYSIQKEANPADHALDVFCGPLGVGADWVLKYKSSSICKNALETVNNCSCPSCEAGEIKVDPTPKSFSYELYLVLQRQMVAHWRTTSYMALRFWWTIVACLLVGLVYLNSGGQVTQIVSALFFYVNVATVPILAAMVPLITERSVFYRETLSGTYSRYVYGTAVQLAEIPFNLGFSMISFVIFYFMVGMSLEAERIVYFILMALASYWVLPAFGQLLAFVSPNIGAAVGVGSLLLTLFTLTMGFLLSPTDIPPWYIWLYWINPLRYMLQGFVVSEIGGKDPEVDDILASSFSWNYDQRWWYCYVVVIMFGVGSFISIILATRISWLKR